MVAFLTFATAKENYFVGFYVKFDCFDKVVNVSFFFLVDGLFGILVFIFLLFGLVLPTFQSI